MKKHPLCPSLCTVVACALGLPVEPTIAAAVDLTYLSRISTDSQGRTTETYSTIPSERFVRDGERCYRETLQGVGVRTERVQTAAGWRVITLPTERYKGQRVPCSN